MQENSANNKIWFLMSRSLSGEATIDEEETLQQMLLQDAVMQQQYDLLKRMWHKEEQPVTAVAGKESTEDISHILKKAKTETAAQVVNMHSKYRYAWRVAAAAAVIILCIGGWYINSSQTAAVIDTQQLEAQNGSRTRTILPDGSNVWLNAGSHISFHKNFTGATREVTLEGEAYFDVVKQPGRPFIVHVSGYDIKVLGTAFNVKSYQTDTTVETTLLRGLVQVTSRGTPGQTPIFLHPNEKLIVHKAPDAGNTATLKPDAAKASAANGLGLYTIQKLDTAQTAEEKIETAWVYNRLEFKGDSFYELSKKLERWYNVTIVFDDEAVQKLNFYGSFETETIQQAFEALKAASNFNYSITDHEIHVGNAGKIKRQ